MIPFVPTLDDMSEQGCFDRGVFLSFMLEGAPPVDRPERYIELRKAVVDLEKTVEAMKGPFFLPGNVAFASAIDMHEKTVAVMRHLMREYEDADPHKVVNDFLARDYAARRKL